MGIWTRKFIKEIELLNEGENNKQLKRSLTTADLIFLGIGATIGAGLFSITGIAAAESAGPAIVIAFILAAIGCAFAGFCYCELATMIPVSGSAYTYAYASMGELPAWLIGWSLILEYAIGAATVAISWSAYVVSLLHDFNLFLPSEIIASPWQTVPLPDGTLTTGIFNLPAFLIIAAISLLLVIGVRQSATFNALIVVVKVGVVVVFIALGAFYIDPSNYTPFIPENTGTFGQFGLSGILHATGVVFFAYIGFDAISTTVLETKNAQKSIPRGILGSLSICTIFYILFSLVLVGIVNYKDLNVAAPVALAISKTPYPWLKGLITLAILAGLTSVILVLLLGQSRIFFVMACDGLLPEFLSKLHPRFRTPWYANILLLAFSGLIASLVPISVLSHLTSIGTLLAFVIVCAGVIILRYTHPEYPRPFKTPIFPWVPLMGMTMCFGIMIFLGWESWLRLIAWLLIGLLIYFGYSYRHAKRRRPIP
jgi:basic amino acid/polyamine antiporter, APA family